MKKRSRWKALKGELDNDRETKIILVSSLIILIAALVVLCAMFAMASEVLVWTK